MHGAYRFRVNHETDNYGEHFANTLHRFSHSGPKALDEQQYERHTEVATNTARDDDRINFRMRQRMCICWCKLPIGVNGYKCPDAAKEEGETDDLDKHNAQC